MQSSINPFVLLCTSQGPLQIAADLLGCDMNVLAQALISHELEVGKVNEAAMSLNDVENGPNKNKASL